MTVPIDSDYGLLIGGQWTRGEEGRTFNSYNPADGKLLATCVDACREDVDYAVAAAWKAFEKWKKISPPDRAAMLLKIADLIEANHEKLAMVETLDVGKPIRDTRRNDIVRGCDHFRYFAGVVRAEEGRAVMIDKDTLSIILKEPLGVVGQVVPWNSPFLMSCWKIAPALASGNCVVIKPSSITSLSMLELGKLLNEVLPAGVVNVVTGRGSAAGNYMLEHEGLRKLAFTGSTEVGCRVAEAAARKLIPATLELGGKSANIFFPDAPWEKAIEGLQIGILANQGQVCCAGSRVFVHEDIHDRFLEEAVAAFDRVRVGLPWDPDTQMGTQINGQQLKTILDYVEIGKAEGAKVACGGYRLMDKGLARGSFMKPTILSEVSNTMRVAREEIFGPVACFIKFRTEDEVVEMANDSEFGLGGGVWTKDINRAFRVASAIQTGRMWVNNYNNNPAHAPFGGYKRSGYGRESHKMMLEHYTQTKNILISLTDARMNVYDS